MLAKGTGFVLFLAFPYFCEQVDGTFIAECKKGNVSVGLDIRGKIAGLLPEITCKYIAIGDQILASMLDKLPSSNLEPLTFLKPLLDQFFFPCINTSRYLNSTLELQSDKLEAGLHEILNHKHLACARTSNVDEYYLVDLLSSEEIMQLLDLENKKDADTPLNEVLTSIHKLLKRLMGPLGNPIMYKLPWLVKHAVADILSNVSNIIMNLITNIMLGILINRSELLMKFFGESLQSVKCSITGNPEKMLKPCEKIDLSIENIISAVHVDLSKSLKCMKVKYGMIADLKQIEDVTNVVIL